MENIYDINDLIEFIKNVGNGNDDKLQERIEKKKKYHKYFDGNSSERVLKLIETKIKSDKNEEKL